MNRSKQFSGLLLLILFLGCGISRADPARIRVALFDDKGSAGKGVPNVLKQLETHADLRVTKVTGPQIAEGALKDFDVVIFTGGSGSRQAHTLGTKGREEVRQFVQRGGGYIGICAGAYLACSGFDWGLGVLNAKTVSPKWQRGKGLVQVEATSLGRQSLQLPAATQQILYANGPIIQPDPGKDLPAYEVLAFYRTELAENGSPSGAMVDTPAIVRGTCGKGRVLSSSPHPEQTAGMEQFIAQAVRWVAGRPATRGASTAVAK